MLENMEFGSGQDEFLTKKLKTNRSAFFASRCNRKYRLQPHVPH
jgi:hypothetical protein